MKSRTALFVLLYYESIRNLNTNPDYCTHMTNLAMGVAEINDKHLWEAWQSWQ